LKLCRPLSPLLAAVALAFIAVAPAPGARRGDGTLPVEPGLGRMEKSGKGAAGVQPFSEMKAYHAASGQSRAGGGGLTRETGRKPAFSENLDARSRPSQGVFGKSDSLNPAVVARRALPRGGERSEDIFHQSGYTRRHHVTQETINHRSPWADPAAKHAPAPMPGKVAIGKPAGRTREVGAMSASRPGAIPGAIRPRILSMPAAPAKGTRQKSLPAERTELTGSAAAKQSR